ncbi:MAG: Hpt domain-containing protein [Herbaspirillum huttiense]|uniref:chemotaxis protein CheA n=1 Tax=Herbaspirillum huttiense TaxID=863372 RepID=UPI001AD5A54E|nr:ATP-binding protein [Herbaspirillum huttiense]MBN9357043.1 Hpt domain-containing protein [Herbaspirillum huttiense]
MILGTDNAAVRTQAGSGIRSGAGDERLRETLRPLLAIVRQQSAAWCARLDQQQARSGLPALTLRTLAALRDYAGASGATAFASSASALLETLQQQGSDGISHAGTRSLLEAGIHSLASQLEGPLAPASEPQAPELIDPLLLPVFLEEAQELIAGIGETLLVLSEGGQPGAVDASLLAELARPLHTLKGSARMVGALHLSRCLHDMEGALQRLGEGSPAPRSVAALLALYDQSVEHFSTLEQGMATLSATGTQAAPSALPGTAAAEGRLTAPLVRIRTTVLDKLLNQVGEVSISRAQLDNEIGALQGDARLLGEDLDAMAQQLQRWQRSWEQGSLQPRDEAATGLTELAKAMEAALGAALARQKRLLQRVVRTREGLRQQGRTTRELQQELMHARMVKFNSMEPRMQHLVRQVAAETGKPLVLDLSDCRLQIDRAILERLMGPLEHLLRNAAVHGIEEAPVRRAAAKPPNGCLRIQAGHEGNEAVIRVSDDGRGLDLAAIRHKAMQRGLPGVEQWSETRLAELIFEPGFSTQSQVSALAGRGIGMDVVRAEVAALGGRMTVHSRPGQGVLFTLYLPLSLAVQQVCLLHHGQQQYAIPSTLIDSVIQLRSDQARQALARRTLEVNGRELLLHPLHVLLDEPPPVPLPGTNEAGSAFALLIKNGDELMVIMADHVSGNREVVVKPVGPQVATLAGMVGATVLGDGQIVLIINPLLLAGSRRVDGSGRAAGVQ